MENNDEAHGTGEAAFLHSKSEIGIPCSIEGCLRQADNVIALYDFDSDEIIPAGVCEEHYGILMKRYHEKGDEMVQIPKE